MRLAFLLLSLFLLSDLAYAQEKPGLLVTPTRVVMEGKDRSASISLVNNGNVEGTYRVSIVNRRMKEDGSIVSTEEPLEGDKFADQMLRISPRQITLKPGEHQNIRMLVRKPQNLADGEYRSHVSVSVLPNDNISDREKESNSNDDSLTISIRANFGVTIPVIIRNGNISATATISEMKFSKENDGSHYVSFNINRSGDESLYGNIMVSYKEPEGKEYVLKSMGGIAVYTPNKKRIFKVKLDVPDGVKIKGGAIEVTYKEKSTEGGKLLASSDLKL